MQFSQIALSLAFVTSLVKAAPMQVGSSNKLAARGHGQPNVEMMHDVNIGSYMPSMLSPVRTRSEDVEKRLSRGKVAAGAAAGVVGWLTTKEGQEFLATDEGKAFASQLSNGTVSVANQASVQARGKADYGSLAAAIINGFNAIRSREVESDSMQNRDVLEARLTAAGLGAAINVFTAAYKGIENNKEVSDADLLSA